MKKYFKTPLLAAFLVAPLSAMTTTVKADDGFYATAKLGTGNPSTMDVREKFPDIALDPNIPDVTVFNFNRNFMGGVAAGYKMAEFHFEMEVMAANADYRKYSEDDSYVKQGGSTITAMANTLIEFDMDYPVIPYVGLGLGYLNIKFSDEGEQDHEVALQGMIGASYPINDNMSWGIEYRYLTTITSPFFGTYDSHNFTTGLRVYF